MRGMKFILELWPDVEADSPPEELLRWAVDSIQSNPDLVWDIETEDRVFRDVKLPATWTAPCGDTFDSEQDARDHEATCGACAGAIENKEGN